MSHPSDGVSRMMGCLFAIIACVFVAIAFLALTTGFLARTSEGQEEVVQWLWGRAAFSVVLAIVAAWAAARVYRRS